MPEIRLDVRLLRPGAIVAGVADGRCVLVRAVPAGGAGAPWVAAQAAGLPVPAVRETRCGERMVLVAPWVDGQRLAPAVAGVALAQAAALGGGLAACGVAASRLRASDLHICDGVLAVRVPVAGPAEDADAETAAFVAMVAEACALDRVADTQRRRRMVPIAIAAVAVLAAAVMLLPDRSPSAPAPARAAAAVVPPAPAEPVAAGPEPPAARVRKPAIRVRKVPARPGKPRRRHRPAAARVKPLARLPTPHSAKRRPAPPPADAVPAAGGDADPLPAR